MYLSSMDTKIADIVINTIDRKTYNGMDKVIVTSKGADGKLYEMSAFSGAWNENWHAGDKVNVEIRTREASNGKKYLNLYPTPQGANTAPEASKMAQVESKPQTTANIPTTEMKQVLGLVSEIHKEIRAIREFMEAEVDFATQMKVISREANE